MEFLVNNRKLIIRGSFALLFTAGAFGFYGMEYSYSMILYFLASYTVYQLICRTEKIRSYPVIWASLLFSILLTITFAIGHQVNVDEKPYFPNLSLLDWAYLLPYSGLIMVCVMNLIDWIMKNEIEMEPFCKNADLRYWRNVFLVIASLWLPYFLVFYPGNITLDSMASIQQVFGMMPLSNWHPITFTAMVGILIKTGMLFGDINFGIACFSFAQMLLLAGILSYCVFCLKKTGVPNWILTLTVLYFALDPINGTLSVTMGKDVLFSGFILLLILLLIDIAQSRGEVLATRKGLVKLAVLYMLVAFWRNNGFYISLVLTAVLVLCYRRYWKTLIPVTITVLCLIRVIQGSGYELLGVYNGNYGESVGIPLQQIAFTLQQEGTVDPQSMEFLNKILPIERWIDGYTPAGVDSIKFDPQFDAEFLSVHSAEFMSVWFKLLPENLVSYIKAWLMNTMGYYHIGTIETAYWVGIIPVEEAEILGIYRTDLLQAVMRTDIVASVIEAFLFYMKKLPVFTAIYSIAVSVWLTLLCTVLLLLRKDHRHLLPLVPLAANWATLMIAAPVYCEFRYMYSFHLAIPIILVLTFRKSTANHGNPIENKPI